MKDKNYPLLRIIFALALALVTGLALVVGPVPVAQADTTQFRATVGGGSGIFADSGQSLGSSSSHDVALGDVDGDGDLDAFVVASIANKVWRNDGTGTFSDSGQSLGSGGSTVVLGDVDGDGDLDAFVVSQGVWLNDGTGTFNDSGQSLGSSASFGVALGDVDGDGDLDAFVTGYGEASKVWLNDGTGSFTDSGQSLGSSWSVAVALGDLDGDGDLDAFLANDANTPNTVWRNDGTGIFTDSGQSLSYFYSWDVELGDVDGDGDLDAFVANSYGEANKVWRNDGTGIFTDSGQSLGNSTSAAVALGDVDGDGDLDAFVANTGGGANKVWLNDGTGTFSDSGQSLGSSWSVDAELGDVDGDGDLDAFVANWKADKVWLNTNQADLALAKTASPDSVNAGGNLTYTIKVTNNGPSDATHVILTDTLPLSVTLVSATASQGSCGGTNTVTCDLGDLEVDASAKVRITVTVDPSTTGTLINTAEVTGNETDPKTCNNMATVTVQVVRPCVTIQRGTFGQVADGYVWKAYPTLGKFDDSRLRTGLLTHPRYGSGETRSLLRFDLDFLPENAVVQSATFGIKQRSPGSGETVYVYRITQAWSEGGPTWNNFASNYDDAVQWGSFASGGGLVTADVTGLVSAWVEGVEANYGMMLINSPAQALDEYISSDYRRVERRPWLEVCYIAP